MEVNPEEALEKANKKFIREFQHMEQRVANEGRHLDLLSWLLSSGIGTVRYKNFNKRNKFP